MPISRPKRLDIEAAIRSVDEDSAAFIDLRPIDHYLDVHIPGSLALLHENGPGMASRARDCIPLEVSLILLGAASIDVDQAAAALKGKGFNVVGAVEEGLTAWGELKGVPASTEISTGPAPPDGALLDVGDPGGNPPPDVQRIPVERLWGHFDELTLSEPIVVVAGYGVRAALAVGILERHGATSVAFWKPQAARRN